jgi:hypothetical protein
MNLDRIEAGLPCPPCGIAEGLYDFPGRGRYDGIPGVSMK